MNTTVWYHVTRRSAAPSGGATRACNPSPSPPIVVDVSTDVRRLRAQNVDEASDVSRPVLGRARQRGHSRSNDPRPQTFPRPASDSLGSDRSSGSTGCRPPAGRRAAREHLQTRLSCSGKRRSTPPVRAWQRARQIHTRQNRPSTRTERRYPTRTPSVLNTTDTTTEARQHAAHQRHTSRQEQHMAIRWPSRPRLSEPLPAAQRPTEARRGSGTRRSLNERLSDCATDVTDWVLKRAPAL